MVYTSQRTTVTFDEAVILLVVAFMQIADSAQLRNYSPDPPPERGVVWAQDDGNYRLEGPRLYSVTPRGTTQGLHEPEGPLLLKVPNFFRQRTWKWV